MAAVNKFPFVKNLRGAEMLVFPGKVQAGSTQAIKAGEICTFNETAGYFVPVDAVADRHYSLAIAYEEQKAADLARYMNFIALRPNITGFHLHDWSNPGYSYVTKSPFFRRS